MREVAHSNTNPIAPAAFVQSSSSAEGSIAAASLTALAAASTSRRAHIARREVLSTNDEDVASMVAHQKYEELGRSDQWAEHYQQLANASFCEYWSVQPPPGPIGYWGLEKNGPIGYTNDWREILKHVVPALLRSLPPDSEARDTIATGHMYLFGVAQGDHFGDVHRMFPNHSLFGFDSFKGLPAEDHEASQRGTWSAGSYPGKVTPEELVAKGGGAKTAHVVPGFFNDTLTLDLKEKLKMRPAFYVDVDCDLHVSTVSALDFLFANGLIKVGTLIGYDDWWTLPCGAFHGTDKKQVSPLAVGEGLAHSEMAARYGVNFRCVAGPCRHVSDFSTCHINNHWAPIFMVESIAGRAPPAPPAQASRTSEVSRWIPQWLSDWIDGSPSPDSATIESGTSPGREVHHGFEFAPDEEKDWIMRMKVCPTV